MMKPLQQFLLSVYILMNFAFVLGVAEDNSFPEKNMIVVIPSYNNKKWYVRNVQSVLSYKKFSSPWVTS